MLYLSCEHTYKHPPPPQGYRTLSPKVWVVGGTSRDGDLITTIVDPDPDEEGEEEVSPMLGLIDLVEEAEDYE